MSRLAVIHTTYSWPPMGGATVDIDEILTRLSREMDVKLFLPRFPRPFSRCRIEGERPFPVEALPFTPWSWRPARIAAAFRRVVTAFAPDHVWVGDGWHLKPWLFDAVAEWRPRLRMYAYENLCLVNNGTLFADGAPCGNHLLNDPERCRNCARRQPVSGFWYRQERLMARAFTARYPARVDAMMRQSREIIVYNRMTADILAPFNPNIAIIPSGVDTRRFQPAPQLKRSAPPMILAPGRMADPVKGLTTLLAAADQLHDRGKRFTLVATAVSPRETAAITGDSRKRSYLQLPGWLVPAAMVPLYQQADLVVVPSHWPEPQGIVAVEALACGAPVVVARIGGLPDLIDEGITGCSYPADNPTALAEVLQELLEDPSRRTTMARAARDSAVNRFDWDRIYQDHYRHRFLSL